MRGRALSLGAPLAALGIGVAAFVWKTRQIAGSIGAGAFPLDDSWIHMQFARNLAEGRGFAYNPGVPVSGSTAPPWRRARVRSVPAARSVPLRSRSGASLPI